MARIGNLQANLVAETGSFQRDLGRAQQQLGGFERTTNQTLAKVQRGWRNFRRDVGRSVKSMFSLRNAAISLAGAGGLGLVVKNSLQTAANIQEMASRAGVGAQALQELTFAAQQYGVRQETLVDGIKELQVRLDEFVATGKGPGADSFERLGISAQDANQLLSQSDRGLQEVINRIRDLDSTAARARAFEEIFGDEAGQQLRQITGDLTTLRDRARELGIVMSDNLIARADELRDDFQALGQVISKQFTVAVVQAADEINTMLRGLANRLPTILSQLNDFFGFADRARGGVITSTNLDIAQLGQQRQAAGELAKVFRDNLDSGNLKQLNAQLREIARGEDAAAGIAQSILERADGTLETAKEASREAERLITFFDRAAQKQQELRQFRDIWEGTAALTGGRSMPTFDGGGGGSSGASGGTGGGGTTGPLSFAGVDFNDRFTMNDAIKETIQLNKEANRQLTEQARAYMKAEEAGGRVVRQSEKLGNYLSGELSNTFDRVGDEVTRMFTRGQDAAVSFRNVTNAVLSDIMQTMLRLGVMNPLKNALFGGNNQTFSGLGGLVGDLVGGLTSSATSSASFSGVAGSVPMGRASGGPVGAGQTYRVGEQGPETFVPAMDGMVVPNGGFKGGGTEVNVYSSEGEPEVRRTRNGNGQERIDLIFDRQAKRAVANGTLDKEMRTRYGITPATRGA
jgi:hypothetical protein